MYRVCGHCDKRVSEKTYKEHCRLFLHDQQWVKDGQFSRASSPICVSDPPDSTSSVQHSPGDHGLSSDASQLQHDPDNFSDEESSFSGYNSFPEKGK